VRESGAFSLLLSLGTNLTLTLSVRVRTVPVKPSFCAVKVPMLAMVISPFGVSRSRPSRPCCEPADGGRAGRTAQRPQQRGGPRGAQNLWVRNPHSGGEIVCAERLLP